MDNNNNIQPAAQPVQPATPVQPVQTVAPVQQAQPVQPGAPVYQPVAYPQYQGQPYPGQQYQTPSPYIQTADQIAAQEKAERRKKANILCFISLGLQILPYIASGILAGITDSIGSLTNGDSTTTSVLAEILSGGMGASYIASWVLMIIARVKYKESVFAKVLMWIYIGVISLSIIAVIIIIAMCAYLVKDCPG